MSNQDAIIAKALNVGLRQLLVAAFIHEGGASRNGARMAALQESFDREIARLFVRGRAAGDDDTELTTAIRKSLRLFVAVAFQQAAETPIDSPQLQ